MSKRIDVIKSLVPHGTRLLDIGSDHALLPISLYKDGAITAAVITDINKGPLARSRSQVASLCPELPCEYVLSDGFDAVSGGYDAVAICGMGGELIADIVARGGEKAHCPLVLQPMSLAEKLREYLWTNGYVIADEHFVVDEDKPYVVMSVRYTGAATAFDYIDLYLGKQRPDTEDYRAYAAKVAAVACNRLIGVRHRGEDDSDLLALISACG